MPRNLKAESDTDSDVTPDDSDIEALRYARERRYGRQMLIDRNSKVCDDAQGAKEEHYTKAICRACFALILPMAELNITRFKQ